ncbi:hypothetical protein BV25DRAFT_1922240 [Artomyces pyxidatus]|uniref:Uncharacterized protein n=1 Tax=Artomyces pyxidatus TaxID=48021 RepID=A0ACB8SFE3_9AGAM|nr:hypothetical protein BV25DRAFT_1922240 [Artomyces pyxidatus]
MADKLTPVKLHSHLFSSHVDATVKDIDDAVKIEMQSAAFIDTPNLIDDMFGFQTGALELILERLVAQGSYVYKSSETPSHWKYLPLDPQTEGVLYTPLTQILNDITAACRPDWQNPTTLPNEPPTSPASAEPLFSPLHPFTSPSSVVLPTTTAPDPLSDPRGLLSTPPLDIVWSDEHSKSPKPPDPFISLMRPDIVASFRASQTDAAVWWRTVHIPLEVKRPSDAHAAAVQLLRYVRQALHVQHDRRFMYGLVFARRSLALWHVDRSGALASEVFDVHENPMKFIQIIVGLMYMDPVQLGWDPTMKMYIKDKGGNFLEPPRFSYEITPTKENTIKQYETAWLVSMNKPGTEDEDEPEIEEFVLWRALSLGLRVLGWVVSTLLDE